MTMKIAGLDKLNELYDRLKEEREKEEEQYEVES